MSKRDTIACQAGELHERIMAFLSVEARASVPTYEECFALVRDAKRVDRSNERACNEGDYDVEKDARLRKAEERIKAFGAKYGIEIRTQGDPRGYAVRLKLGAHSNNFGGDWGIG